MNKFSSFNRGKLIQDLSSTYYDVLIIGGGITGAGIALDAASRGLKTALVEKNDFASGTSSRSTKLIHGGLRYLKQFEIALVREVGRERAIVHKLAPHLVVSEKMLLPLIKGGTFGKFTTSFGLMIYDVLAGVEKADQRKMLDKEETLNLEPLLPEDKTEGAGLYSEYRTDDARLTIEVIKTAVSYNADCINYLQVDDFLYEDKKVSGITGKDLLLNKEIEIKSRFIVSAAGPWVDELRSRNKSKKGKRLHLTKGVHIVLPKDRLPIKHSIYFDVPDGRMIFAIPRGKVTYIGTTDTNYKGSKEEVTGAKEDVEYLINGINHTFKVDLKVEDVVSSWAGLRPLIHEEGKSASELSRKDEIFESDSGLISIAGGKLTGYRLMAQKVVDLLGKKMNDLFDIKVKKCFTDKIILSGGVFNSAEEVSFYKNEIANRLKKYDLNGHLNDYLVSNYGKQTDHILNYFLDIMKIKNNDYSSSLALAELMFTLNYESVHGVLDFFSRRTGRLYFDIESIRTHKNHVLNYMKERLGWNDNKMNSEKKLLEEAVYRATHYH